MIIIIIMMIIMIIMIIMVVTRRINTTQKSKPLMF